MQRHHLKSPWRRASYSLLLIVAILFLGTAGMHALEGLSWMDAFYFISMIATAQGPPTQPATAAGKLFAACMAFLSVGVAVTALGFLFGPLLGRLWRIGHDASDPTHRPGD